MGTFKPEALSKQAKGVLEMKPLSLPLSLPDSWQEISQAGDLIQMNPANSIHSPLLSLPDLVHACILRKRSFLAYS